MLLRQPLGSHKGSIKGNPFNPMMVIGFYLRVRVQGLGFRV